MGDITIVAISSAAIGIAVLTVSIAVSRSIDKKKLEAKHADALKKMNDEVANQAQAYRTSAGAAFRMQNEGMAVLSGHSNNRATGN
jgi:ABC-type antimicrobial peptide transport system permease subunit